MADMFSTESAESDLTPDCPDWERWASAVADGFAAFPSDAPTTTQERLAALVARRRRSRLLRYLARLTTAEPARPPISD